MWQFSGIPSITNLWNIGIVTPLLCIGITLPLLLLGIVVVDWCEAGSWVCEEDKNSFGDIGTVAVGDEGVFVKYFGMEDEI